MVALLITHLPQATTMLIFHQLNHLAIRSISKLATILINNSHKVGTTCKLTPIGPIATITKVLQISKGTPSKQAILILAITHSLPVVVAIWVKDLGSKTHSYQMVLVAVDLTKAMRVVSLLARKKMKVRRMPTTMMMICLEKALVSFIKPREIFEKPPSEQLLKVVFVAQKF